MLLALVVLLALALYSHSHMQFHYHTHYNQHLLHLCVRHRTHASDLRVLATLLTSARELLALVLRLSGTVL